MTRESQLQLWLAGKSVHNPCDDNCCPDFSCCTGLSICSIELRNRYIHAYQHKDTTTISAIEEMFFECAVLEWIPDGAEPLVYARDPEPHEH